MSLLNKFNSIQCCVKTNVTYRFRYLAISRPFKYNHIMTTKSVVLLISAAWASALMISIVPVLLKWHLKDPSVLPVGCELTLNTPYALISSSISFYIPAAIILGTNCRVFLIARGQQIRIRKTVRETACSTSKKSTRSNEEKPNGTHSTRVHQNEPNGENPKQLQADQSRGRDEGKRRSISNHILSRIGVSKPQLKHNQKATVTIGIIISTFLICWTPFFFCNVLFHFCCENFRLFTIVTWIGYINSCFNPVILYSFNREYRNAFQTVLKLKRGIQNNRRTFSIQLDAKC